jgi:hypothetical protein
MATNRNPLEPLIIGADVGNATTSLATPAGTIAFFPSVVTTLGVRPYEGLSKVAGTTFHHITYAGRHTVIGADALEMAGADTILNETAEPHVRYTEEVSLLCFLAGISSAFPLADTLAVQLATGAPVSIYEAATPAIVARYQGEHRYTYNGHARRVLVERVHVFGEGREAWRLLSPEQRRGNVAVHDLGGKTWNVLLFKDGVFKTARTFDAGTERLLDDVSSVSKDPAARWALQAELRKNPKAHPAIRAELEKRVAAELPIIERKVALPKAEHHVLLGGGAVHLSAALRRRYNVPVVSLNGESPEGANALAYALAAANSGQLAVEVAR